MSIDSLNFLPWISEKLAENSRLRIIVTGGRGWIGRACLEMLDCVFGEDISHRILVFGSSSGTIRLSSGRILTTYPIGELDQLDGDLPVVIAHFAFLTKEKTADRSLQDFIHDNSLISSIIERAILRLRPMGLIMISSGAATQTNSNFALNPYGFMKREDELRFQRICIMSGSNYCCPRLFNLSGPFINKIDSYMLPCIISDTLANRSITIHANKPVIRSYVHVGDLLNVAFADILSQNEESPAIFETAGEVEIEIGDLAKLVLQVLDRPDAKIIRPKLDLSLKPDRYVGTANLWRERIVRYTIEPMNLEQQILSTANYLSSLSDTSIN